MEIEQPETAVLKISGYINTDFAGIRTLYKFYDAAKEFKNQHISIDFYNLQFLDGNLCALFLSLLHKLTKENNLSFSTDGEFIKKKFHVLARNGFVHFNEEIADVQKSTLGLKYFNVGNLDEFVEYVQQDLGQHRGMKLSEDNSEKVMSSIIEVATNIEIHSNSNEPFFACGQYYPENKVFKFTMVDLGDGFLPAISKSTGGTITTSESAIDWALQLGNTTKVDEPGGLGLPDLRSYFAEKKGHLQIVTGDAFWSTELAESRSRHKKFSTPCFGTIVNLLFSFN